MAEPITKKTKEAVGSKRNSLASEKPLIEKLKKIPSTLAKITAAIVFVFGTQNCTFDHGGIPNLDGDSGVVDASKPDSGIDAGPLPDAGVDAGPLPDAGIDAGPLPDAGVDAGPLPDAGPGCIVTNVSNTSFPLTGPGATKNLGGYIIEHISGDATGITVKIYCDTDNSIIVTSSQFLPLTTNVPIITAQGKTITLRVLSSDASGSASMLGRVEDT